MIQTIEVFYTFQCPYCYLAIDRLSELDQKYDVQVLFQPYSAKAAGHNQQSPMYTPERVSYIKEDVVRLAKKANMPLVMHDDWPEREFDPERSVRGAVIASDLGMIMEYNIKMFHRWWGEGEDPNEQGFFIELCDDMDIDPNEFSGRINMHDTRERIRGLYRRGRKYQIFDTPTIVIGEERFYGIERIDEVEERLNEMGMRKANR